METVLDARQGDRIVGEWRQPQNRWQAAPNSIHNDAVARRIGMRGGTIPGTVHLSHFRPILTELFGERWLTRGSISMYYTFATIDREDVRAVVGAPPPGVTDDVQLQAWVETPDGRTVCKGTVAVGTPDATPYIRGLPLENAPAGANRILADARPGLEAPPKDDHRVTEGLDPDGVLRDPQFMYRALQVFPPSVDVKGAVGFFGATEIVLHSGPIRGDVAYRKTGKVAAVGESPKTEFLWIDSALHDPDGRLVAEMRHMTRWMKVSSPLWAD